MNGLTPLQQKALTLYLSGITSPTQIGKALGVTRQRGQEIITALRTKVLTEQPSRWASVQEAYPPDSRANPFPRYSRRAMHPPFVLRGTMQLREDGLDITEGAVPDECSVIWTHRTMPRDWGYTWTTDRTRPWTMQHTRAVYQQWCDWHAEHHPHARQLPSLSAGDAALDVAELTRTIAWVIGTEALISETPLPVSA